MSKMSSFMIGMQAGTQMGTQIANAFIRKQMMEEDQRQSDVREAVLQAKNPGLYITPRSHGKEVEVDGETMDGEIREGEKVSTANATPFKESDDIQSLGKGGYFSKSIANKAEDDDMNRKLEFHNKTQDAQAVRQENIEKIRQGFMSDREKNRLQMTHDDLELRLQSGDIKQQAAIQAKMDEIDKRIQAGQYGNKATKAEDSLALKRYNTSLASVKSYQKMLESNPDDEEAQFGLKVAQKAMERSSVQAGLTDPAELEEIRRGIGDEKRKYRMSELEGRGDQKKPWLWFNSGRSDDEQKEYDELKGMVSGKPGGSGNGKVKKLTPEIAAQFLSQAKGDRAKAEKMAASLGYQE
jgi:hypothetical protein